MSFHLRSNQPNPNEVEPDLKISSFQREALPALYPSLSPYPIAPTSSVVRTRFLLPRALATVEADIEMLGVNLNKAATAITCHET